MKSGVVAGLVAGATGMLLAGIPQQARALTLYDGQTQGNGLEINLDTTVSWTGIWRTNNPSKVVISDINANDGDLALAHGMVSDLFEATSVLDIKDGGYGAHFSGDAFLNPTYLGTNQNNSDTTNPIDIAKSNDFASATRNVNGENAKVLDAFVYGTEHFGADSGQTFNWRIGRQTVLWGESLLLASNGLAGSMSPIDTPTAQSNPNAETNAVILPVGQVVLTYSPSPMVTMQGYYQFEWEPYQLQGVGAFFSSADILDKGGQRILLAPGFGILRTKDVRPEAQNGQFGASLKLSLGEYDLGLYVIRYDSKTPTVFLQPGGPLGVSSYRLEYARDIWAEAASLGWDIGPVNMGAETDYREHVNLNANGGLITSANTNVNSNPGYPYGDVWSGQISMEYISAGIPLDPGGVALIGETGFNHLVTVTGNRDLLVQGHQATAAAAQMIVEPTYYDVVPNLEVQFPIGLEYDYLGRSMWNEYTHGVGDFNIGVSATYKSVWTAELLFNDNLGKVSLDPNEMNTTADRNYILANLQYSF